MLRDSKRQEGQDEAEKWNFSGFQEPGVMLHPGRLQTKVIKKFPERTHHSRCLSYCAVKHQINQGANNPPPQAAQPTHQEVTKLSSSTAANKVTNKSVSVGGWNGGTKQFKASLLFGAFSPKVTHMSRASWLAC